MIGLQLLSLLLIGFLRPNGAMEQFTSIAFDNYHLECGKSSGIKKLSVSLVGSQGSLRRDIVFSFSCQRINTLFPWNDIPEAVAELEREDCYYSTFMDPLVDENTLASCGKREYIAGITRLSTTKVRFLCCRLRTKDETNCVERNFLKPTDMESKIDVAQDGMVINAISINKGKYTVRFCSLKARDIDTLIKDVGTTRQTKIYPKTTLFTTTTSPTLTSSSTSPFTSTFTFTSTAASATTSTVASTFAATNLSTIVIPKQDNTTVFIGTTSAIPQLLLSNNRTEEVNETVDNVEPITFPSVEFDSQKEDHDMISQKVDMPPEDFFISNLTFSTEIPESITNDFSLKDTKFIIVASNGTDANDTEPVMQTTLMPQINEQNFISEQNKSNETYGVDFSELQRLNISEIGKEIRRKQPSSSYRRGGSLLEAWNDGKHHIDTGDLKKQIIKKSSKKHESLRVTSTALPVTVATTTTQAFETTIIRRSTVRPQRVSPRLSKISNTKKMQTATSVPTTTKITLKKLSTSALKTTTQLPTTPMNRPVQRFTTRIVEQNISSVTRKPTGILGSKPKIMVFTKTKRPNLKLQQTKRLKQSAPISAVIAVKSELNQKQNTKKVFKNFGNNYSQVVSSTLLKQNKTNSLETTMRSNIANLKAFASITKSSERRLKDDSIHSENSVMPSWYFDNADLLSSLHKKQQPGFYKTAGDEEQQSKFESGKGIHDAMLLTLRDGSASSGVVTAAAETNVQQNDKFYGRLRDGVRTFKPKFGGTLTIPESSLLKEKSKKYFGKKPTKTEDDIWNLNIFDDLESYSVDMPPESFSPDSMSEELVPMAAASTLTPDNSMNNSQYLALSSHKNETRSVNHGHTVRSSARENRQLASTINAIPHDPAKFYHTPSPKLPALREKVLTFCNKDVAVRDMNNLVIACGDNFEIWRPKRCPEKSDCFFAKDSTYRICCPVAETASSIRTRFNRFS